MRHVFRSNYGARFNRLALGSLLGVGAWAAAANPATLPTTKPSGTAKVSVLGLMIEGPDELSDDKLSVFRDNPGPATRLFFRIDVPDGNILELHGALRDLSDGHGNLVPEATTRPVTFELGDVGIDRTRMVAPTHRTAEFNWVLGKLPSPGARALRVQSDLSVLVGLEKKEMPPIALELRNGTKIKIGGIEFEISEVGPSDDDKFKFKFSLVTDSHAPLIAGLRFVDSTGKRLESGGPATTTVHDGKDFGFSWDYLLPTKLAAVQVVPTLWTRTREDKIPVNMSIGVGLGEPQTPELKDIPSDAVAEPGSSTRETDASTTQPATTRSTDQNEVQPVVLRGLRVLRPLDIQSWGWGMHEYPGTTVALQVIARDGHLISYGSSGTKLDVFTDNLGRNLLQPIQGGSQPRFESAKYTRGDTSFLFTIVSPHLPDEHATQLTLRGVLGLRVAHHLTRFAQDVKLRDGETFQFANVHYAFKDVGNDTNPFHPFKGFSFTYETKDNEDYVDSLTFADEHDKPLDTKQGMRGHWSKEGGEYQLIIPVKRETVRVVAEVWDDAKEVTVPLDFTTSIGAPPNAWAAPAEPTTKAASATQPTTQSALGPKSTTRP